MNRTVIVYGPQGCGKTNASDRLMRHFGCTELVDDWDGESPLPDGALALTNRKPVPPVGARVVPFVELAV